MNDINNIDNNYELKTTGKITDDEFEIIKDLLINSDYYKLRLPYYEVIIHKILITLIRFNSVLDFLSDNINKMTKDLIEYDYNNRDMQDKLLIREHYRILLQILMYGGESTNDKG